MGSPAFPMTLFLRKGQGQGRAGLKTSKKAPLKCSEACMGFDRVGGERGSGPEQGQRESTKPGTCPKSEEADRFKPRRGGGAGKKDVNRAIQIHSMLLPGEKIRERKENNPDVELSKSDMTGRPWWDSRR